MEGTVIIVRELVTLLGYKVDDSGRKQYNQGIDQTKQKQQSMTSSLLKANLITSVVSKGIGAAFSFIRDSVIGTTAETERFRVALGTMMGDQERANKIIRDLDYGEGMFEGVRLSDFYGTANAIGGLQNMVTFGMQAEEAGDVLARLGDIAQGDSEAFVSMSNAMGQVFARGKADSVKLKQFASQGFDVVGEVAKLTGKSRAEVEKSGVTYEQTAAALKTLTNEGGKYHGMLAKQMNTLGGLIKQYKSFQAATAEAIGFGISEELKELLKYILAVGRAGQESFVNGFVGVLKEVIHWIWQVIIMFKVLGFRIADMGDALGPVKNFFSDLKNAAGDAFTGIMILAVEIGKLIIASFRPIQAFASPIIKELGVIAKDVFTAIGDFIRPLSSIVSGSTELFGFMGKTIAGIIRPLLKIAVAIKGVNTAIAIGKGAIAAFNTAMNVGSGLSALFSGNLLKMAMNFRAAGVSQKAITTIGSTFDVLTGKVDLATAAANKNRLAQFMLDHQITKLNLNTIKSIVVTKAKAVADKIAALATKIWTGVQIAFNAIMTGNPIALIILGVMALITAIILLVKNWDKLVAWFKEKFPFLYQVILGFVEIIKSVFAFIKNIISGHIQIWVNIFKAIVAAVKGILSAFLGIFKAIFGGIFQIVKNTFGAIFNTIFGILDGIIRIWSGYGNIFQKILDSIKLIFSKVWEGIKQLFLGNFEAIIGIAKSFGNFFKSIFDGFVGIIFAVFNGIWNGLKLFFDKAINFIKKNLVDIVNIILIILFPLAGIMMALVRLIIKHWDTIKEAVTNIFKNLVNNISQAFQWAVDKAIAIWETLKTWFSLFIESIKNIWSSITDWFSGLWEGIINVAIVKWENLKLWFSGLVDGIKSIWNGIIGFFIGLWEAMKQGPTEAIEYLKNAFLGLFNSLQEKLFGFINKIKEGWESVKGFFGGIADGVINFFTGGNVGQAQPAYASATQAAVAGSVGQTSNYAYNSTGGNSSINARTSINVNVPTGTPQEQGESIARQIDAQFNARLLGSINSSRANIPSPEVRRH